MMFLVRDFNGERIVYFWARKTRSGIKKASPNCPSIQIAQEWFLNFTRSQYAGPERRKRHYDRRLILNRRKDVDQLNDNDRRQKQGRRLTDQRMKVKLDLAAKKLAELSLNYSLKDQ